MEEVIYNLVLARGLRGASQSYIRTLHPNKAASDAIDALLAAGKIVVGGARGFFFVRGIRDKRTVAASEQARPNTVAKVCALVASKGLRGASKRYVSTHAGCARGKAYETLDRLVKEGRLMLFQGRYYAQ